MSSKLDAALVDRAVNALFKYEKNKTQTAEKVRLIDSFAKPILAQIQLTTAIAKSVLKPVRVKIPNSMFSPDDEEHSVCLFCRTEDKAQVEEYLTKNKFHGLTKVLSINDVKKFHKDHKDKKKLLNEHTHFVSDARVVRQLYNLLGNVFGARNNYPIPIDIEKVDKIHASVQKAIDSSFMSLSGKNITIRLGHTAMNQKQVIENVIEGLNFAILKFKGEWRDVHNIHLKTSDSAALPIYSKVADEMLNFVAAKAGVAAPVAAGQKAKATKKNGKATIEAVVTVPTTATKTPVKAAAATTATPAKAAAATPAKVATPAPVAATKAAATPAAKTPAPTPAKGTATPAKAAEPFVVSPEATAVKKRKASEEPIVEAVAAPVAPVTASKAKKGKAAAAVVVAAAVEEPVVVPAVEEKAPTTAKKGTRKTAATAAEVEVEEPVVKTPAAKRSHKKAVEAEPVAEKVEVAEPTPKRRSTRAK